jgi:hypothetical protein
MNEAPRADKGPRTDGSPARVRVRLGCLSRIALVIIAAAALIVVIGETFDQGPNAKQPSRGVDAGPAEEYPPGDLTHLVIDHVFVVRLQDGTFLALYDRSPKQQELDSGCRVLFDESAQLIGKEQLPGFTGAFVEECAEGARATWRADGVFASGASYGGLDRFDTSVNADGNLIVKTSSRTCTKSRGVIGLPPYDVKTCSGTPK